MHPESSPSAVPTARPRSTQRGLRTGLVLSIVVLAAGLAVALAGAISFRSDEQGPDVTAPTTSFDPSSETLEPTSRFLISVGPDDPISPAPTLGPTDPIPVAPATVYMTVTVTDAGLVGRNPVPASQLVAAPPVAAPTTFVIAAESGGSGAAIISMAGGVLVSLIGAGSALYVARLQRRPVGSDDDENSPVSGEYRPAASLYPNGSAAQPAPSANVPTAPATKSATATSVSSTPAEPGQPESS